MKVVTEDAFNHPDRVNELYLWGVLQAHQVMAKFLNGNFTGHPKFHTQMVVFKFDTMVPQVDI